MSELATHVFGAAHAEIQQITSSDPIAQTYTYGTVLDVPGLKNVTVNVSSDSKELRGDHTLLAKETIVQNIEVELEFAKWDATIFAAITGSTVTTTENGYSLTVNANNTPGTFSLRAHSASTSSSGQIAEIYFPQLKIANIPDMLGLVEEEFKTVTVTCEVIPTYQGAWMTFNYGDAVGGGEEPTTVAVPDVIGDSESVAIAAIVAAGLEAAVAYTTEAPSESWDTVVFTDPEAGELVALGSEVVLVVAVETLPGLES